MTLEALIEKFLKHCRRRGSAANTLRGYRSRLKQLTDHFGAKKDYRAIDREGWLDFLFEANRWPEDHKSKPGQEKSASTRRLNIIVLKLLQEYARDFHKMPALLEKQDLEKPAVGERERIATDAEVTRILELAKPDWQLLYQALRFTGARPGELVRALIEDIDPPGPPFRNAVIAISQHKTARKTGKPRRIPIGGHVEPILIESIGERTEGLIFLDRKGKPWNVPRASRIFRKIRNELNLPDEIVFYCTRHEFGSKVTATSGINTAKELLGHTDIKTTQKYVHMTKEQLQAGQEAAFLRSQSDVSKETDSSENR